MGDIYVHEMLRKCCRDTLAELDEKKKVAKAAQGLLAVGSLVTMFGGSPVDVAIEELAKFLGTAEGERRSSSRTTVDQIDNATGRHGDLEAILRDTCAKICELHSLDHTGTEARFWSELATAFDTPSGNAARKEREAARAAARGDAVKRAIEEKVRVKAFQDELARKAEEERRNLELDRIIDEGYPRIEAEQGKEAADRWVEEVMKRHGQR